ncbi:hypothetical protein LOK49_LG13G00392 [Camellia lanceoleosa]|uniref:Uncharacterized protein n=1 Tax=Camellia lanceoleosa TaxID=1840588 RepID=A0ACC0FLU6_9ERIC|nr:hypothetical protein LOK49_LG13G00392 [Camellia lanceoleosa]
MWFLTSQPCSIQTNLALKTTLIPLSFRFLSPNFPEKMSPISKAIVSWHKKHPDGDDNGDDEYDYAPVACTEGDDDDDGDGDYAPAA